MIKAPDVIYLQIEDDGNDVEIEKTWTRNRINDKDVEYVRPELAFPKEENKPNGSPLKSVILRCKIIIAFPLLVFLNILLFSGNKSIRKSVRADMMQTLRALWNKYE